MKCVVIRSASRASSVEANVPVSPLDENDQFLRACQVLEASDWLKKIADYESLVHFASSLERSKFWVDNTSPTFSIHKKSEFIIKNYAQAISTAAKLPCPGIVLQMCRFAEQATPSALCYQLGDGTFTVAFSSLMWILCTSNFEQLLGFLYAIFSDKKTGLDFVSASLLFESIFTNGFLNADMMQTEMNSDTVKISELVNGLFEYHNFFNDLSESTVSCGSEYSSDSDDVEMSNDSNVSCEVFVKYCLRKKSALWKLSLFQEKVCSYLDCFSHLAS